LGHRLSANGFEIDQDKIQDVKNFTKPTNVTDARSFLGLAAYLSEYIPNYAKMVKPMWDMVAKKPFAWTEDGELAFEETKRQIADCIMKLSFFDEDAQTFLYTDASPYALGAVLTQEKDDKRRIISFASKTLTKTEQAYPQIQKEALGVVWGTERFYYYLLGRKFTIRTDARGLAFIFDREKTTCKRALNRAEGWALRLDTYDFVMEWVKGKVNIADPPSRLVTNPQRHPGMMRVPVELYSLENGVAITEGEWPALTVEAIKAADLEDAEITSLLNAIETGIWPAELRKFEKISEELRVCNGIVTRLGAVVIPEALRCVALRLGHSGHPGQAAMKSIMRGRVWWHCMPTDIEEFVQNCAGCKLVSRPERPVPMLTTVLPEEQWVKLAVDFNGPHSACGGRSVLVLVDYYSRYVSAKFVKSTDFRSVAPVLEEIFGELGYPRSIRSDNGPPFNGEEWAAYCKTRGIDCEFSTPGHPQQNGLVERYMQLCNKAITMAVETGANCEEALKATMAAHNAVVQRTTRVAPEVLLFGRRLRRRLPQMGPAGAPVDRARLREQDECEKSRTQERENRKRRAHPTSIEIGDTVLMKRLIKAKDQTVFDPERYEVIAKNRGDMTIKGGNGKVFKRNVVQLKKAGSAVQEEQGNDSDRENQSRGNQKPEAAEARPRRTKKGPQRLTYHVHDEDESEK
jgi:transposase InsO family protein